MFTCTNLLLPSAVYSTVCVLIDICLWRLPELQEHTMTKLNNIVTSKDLINACTIP